MPSNTPPPEEGWAEEATVTKVDARSLTADLKAELRAEMRTAIDSAVIPLERKVAELSAALDRERKERAELESKVAAIAAAPPPTPVAARPTPRVQRAAAAVDVFVSEPPPNERTARTMPPTGNAPTLRFDTAPYPDMPGMLDGSRRKKMVTWFVTFILVFLVSGVGLMTIFSYAH
jgi:hypothetical protein